MNKTTIIIPSRLNAQRFPNKPLKLINNKEMILHVYDAAVKSNAGEVYVATPDQKIVDTVKNSGGNVIKTSENHETGTDRIFEVFKTKLNSEPNIIINLQGDMPNIKPNAILRLEKFMRSNNCDIGTMASNIKDKNEITDPNVVKVHMEEKLKEDNFLNAKDFFRTRKILSNEKIYHHIGIYAFTNDALTKYVKLKRSKLEIERNLEQMRAMENNLIIKVGLCDSKPLGVDTEKDLIKVRKEMN